MDIVAQVDDVFIDAWNFPKGICTYFDLEAAKALQAALPSPEYVSGGCAANAAAVAAALGGNTAFIGRIADDEAGRMFLKDLQDGGIRYTGKPDTNEGAGSTLIFTMTTPDTQRTFAGYYGQLDDLSDADLDQTSLTQSKFLYLDGYTLNTKRGDKFFLKAAEIAKKAGNKVVFAPCDLSVLKEFDDIIETMLGISDGITCSSDEAILLTKEAALDEAIEALRKRVSFGAVTVGDKGVYVFDEKGIKLVPAAMPPAPVVDTNGAGDAFAGGFLY
jgi:sugar/nucleoside kinase (ribokinase family)